MSGLKFLQKNFQNVKNKIIILDNASSHKNKKDLGYEKLYQNVENISKEIPEEIYYNLIFGAYFKPPKKRKINSKKEKIYLNLN